MLDVEMKEKEETHKDGLEKLEQDYKEEVSTLKAFANDIKARLAVYIPNKTDQIDVKLGQYLNNYPDKRKLKFTFCRQAQGKYVFGSRLVVVKVDGSSIHVQTENRSIPIGEFIDEFTPKELKKVELRDPTRRLRQNEPEFDGASRDASPAGFGDTLTIDAKSATKQMRRSDSKATVRTSATKTAKKKVR